MPDRDPPPRYDDDGSAARIARSRKALAREAPERVIARAAELLEIVRHREWRIAELEAHAANLAEQRDGLQAHARNLEQRAETASTRILALEEHADHLERRAAELARHVANLEGQLAGRDERIAALEAHTANIERRLERGLPRSRLRAGGIFPKTRDPQLAKLFALGERLRAEREDLQRRFPDDAAPAYWAWLLSVGRLQIPQIDALLPPAPDASLVRRVIGEGATPDAWRESGITDWRSIDESLRIGGFDPLAGGRLLDFGAGCGRILPCFRLYGERWELHGADVDAEAMAWCTGALPFARFHTLPAEPPAPLEPASFDAIYAFSVFSHLGEARHLAWLRELARIARPGASVVLTVHGATAAGKIASGALEPAHPRAAALAKRRAELDERGFLFFPYERLPLRDARNRAHFERWDLAEYGTAFVLEPWVRARWSEWFELVEIREAPDDWQDHVVLRRR